MKQLITILTEFIAICALLSTSACSGGIPSTQVAGTDPTIILVSTEQPPTSVPAAVSENSTPSAQKPSKPTKVPKETRKSTPRVPTSNTLLNPDFIATEILGRPTDTTITINLVPTLEMELYYEYGTAMGVYTAQTTVQTAVHGEAVETLLSGLQPNTRHYYRLRYRSAADDFTAGQEHTFMTQRTPGSTFTFAIQGDSHPERFNKQFDPELYTHTLLSAAAIQPDFYFTIGDDFSVDKLKTVNSDTVAQLYLNQRQFLGQVGSSSPLFLVNGNHEQAALANLDGTPDNVAVWAQNARNRYYPQPAPDSFYTGDSQPVEYIGLLRDYYAWTWGDALFVVIDPYWHSATPVDNVYGSDKASKKNRDLWDITIGDAQYQWFKHTLEGSSAKYKFVFTHHVHGTGRGGIELAGLYEWGGKDRDGNNIFAQKRPGWDKPVHQLMVDNHVTIFFQGHDHIFVRQELDGLIYQTLPEPADPNYTLYNADAYQFGEKFPNSGHVRVTVSPNGVTVDYIRSYLDRPDELAFTYTVH